eukprot:TRINITY_DN3225_c0_g1_i1.p1 TRINITY_DN3225_c0_g1~~TRINITY_DN3225_c0_g1_i1.p1  ORF type:complete len:371 (+),score=40.81 TRINITY_DN3225_c0_g1_i1:98-1210(+)
MALPALLALIVVCAADTKIFEISKVDLDSKNLVPRTQLNLTFNGCGAARVVSNHLKTNVQFELNNVSWAQVGPRGLTNWTCLPTTSFVGKDMTFAARDVSSGQILSFAQVPTPGHLVLLDIIADDSQLQVTSALPVITIRFASGSVLWDADPFAVALAMRSANVLVPPPPQPLQLNAHVTVRAGVMIDDEPVRDPAAPYLVYSWGSFFESASPPAVRGGTTVLVTGTFALDTLYACRFRVVNLPDVYPSNFKQPRSETVLGCVAPLSIDSLDLIPGEPMLELMAVMAGDATPVYSSAANPIIFNYASASPDQDEKTAPVAEAFVFCSIFVAIGGFIGTMVFIGKAIRRAYKRRFKPQYTLLPQSEADFRG